MTETSTDTREADRHNGIAEITSSAQEAKEMRANLAVYARRSGDPETVALVNQVLRGERNVRDVLTSRRFNEVGGAHLANLEEGIRRMPVEQRERMLDRMTHGELPQTPDDELDDLRDEDLAGQTPLDADGEVVEVEPPPPPEQPRPRGHVLGR